MTNKEFMFMPRAIVQHNTKISDVINYLENSSEKCILVMNNEKFVGLITKQELHLAIQNISTNSPIRILFQKKSAYLTKNDSIIKAKLLMSNNDTSVVAVLDGEEFIGAIRKVDIMLQLYHW